MVSYELVLTRVEKRAGTQQILTPLDCIGPLPGTDG